MEVQLVLQSLPKEVLGAQTTFFSQSVAFVVSVLLLLCSLGYFVLEVLFANGGRWLDVCFRSRGLFQKPSVSLGLAPSLFCQSTDMKFLLAHRG